jgi:hypothetical protein
LNYVVNFFISLIVSLSVVAGYAFFWDRPHEEHFYVLDMKKVLQEQLKGMGKINDPQLLERFLKLNAEKLQTITDSYDGIILIKGSVVENEEVRDITQEVIYRLSLKGNGS